MSAPISYDYSSLLLTGAEQNMIQISQPGIYRAYLNLFTMAAGDTIIVRVYKMVITGGTARKVEETSYSGVQSIPTVKTDIYESDLNDANNLRFTIQQTAIGVYRTIDYDILQF